MAIVYHLVGSCNGFISLHDFTVAVSEVAPQLSDYVVDAAFRQIDTDRDNRVGYRDFETMMKLAAPN
jgi:Ca2+-binding EF-hand superfamily protein